MSERGAKGGSGTCRERTKLNALRTRVKLRVQGVSRGRVRTRKSEKQSKSARVPALTFPQSRASTQFQAAPTERVARCCYHHSLDVFLAL